MKEKILPVLLSALFSSVYAQNIYVTPDGTGDCSQENPCNLNVGINKAAQNGESDVIYLKEGTYYANNVLYVPSADEGNVTIEGQGLVILDGANAGRILLLDTSLTDDDGKSVEIKNIVFKNGLLEGNNDKGAALHIKTKYANIKVENCKFENNTVTQDADGAGLYIKTNTGDVSLIHSVFNNNQSDDYSGGFDIFSAEGKITVSHNIVKNNSGGYGGGGSIETSIGKIYFINNLVFKNKSTALGSGRGGGIFINLNAGESYIINNTIVDNNSSAYGGGIHIKAFYDTGKMYIYNNILYDNNADKNGSDLYIETENGEEKFKPLIYIENNDYKYMYIENQATIENEGKLKEKNNLSEEPLFKDKINEDYHLSENSPLIDKGNSSPILPLPEIDIDGDPRPMGNGIDIGVDEVVIQGDNTGDNTGENTDKEATNGNGGGGGGCSLASTTSPINALLYLALPFVLLVRRFLRG